MKKVLLSLMVIAFVFVLIGCSKKYIVSFDSQGGNQIASVEVGKGESVSKPSNPLREGYTFIEWQLNGMAYDFSKEVVENITLVAKWERIIPTYTISYDAQGATLPSDVVTSFEENDVVALPEVSKAGYNFLGWYEGETKVEQIENKNYELVAKFEAINYTISYTNSGNAVSNPTEYTIESETIVLSNPTKEG